MQSVEKIKRIFLLVLDSLGAGELPDAEAFGDAGAHTLRSIYRTGRLQLSHLTRLGIGNIEGLDFLGPQERPCAAYGRMRERSMGKDTTTGHWEIAGLVSDHPMPTYPQGFPKEIIDAFCEKTGCGVLCNQPYSGTEVLLDYGREHISSGKLIVYTSADSVFQIAAHDSVMSNEELYECCRAARTILVGEHGVGRVIARPFTGEYPNYIRTDARRDFSLEPPQKTMLDKLKENGFDTISVGKITDIFAGRGITKSFFNHENEKAMEETAKLAKEDFNGLCFVNLVDFDTLYGHRNDAEGYADALMRFDCWLGDFLKSLRREDLLMITADHGCDPGDVSTDHTREHVPLLVWGERIRPAALGTRNSFSDVAATVLEAFGVQNDLAGNSFLSELFC